MSPLSNQHKFRVHTDSTKGSSKINKIESVSNKQLSNLPSHATVHLQQVNKPTAFNESFADLIKPLDLNLKHEMKAGVSMTAPFIFLGKMGSSIVDKFKKVLESLKSTPGMDTGKLVNEAKKSATKAKVSKTGAFKNKPKI